MPELVAAYALPELAPAPALRGGIAVIIDILRASTTITAALGAGAARVVPCLEPADALRLRDALAARGERALLGGERGGVRIDGFDLGNSPAEYAPGTVAGRTVVFTTTNGTRALMHAVGGRTPAPGAPRPGADRVLVGCFNNLGSLVGLLARDPRPVHLLCAGTRGSVALEDCLFAGAMTAALVGAGLRTPESAALREHPADAPPPDQSILFAMAYHAASGGPGGLLGALRMGRGGWNVAHLGLAPDIEACARTDTTPVVPELDFAAMELRPAVT